MTLTWKLARDFYPVYVSTKQKADVCNSYQVIMQTDTHYYQGGVQQPTSRKGRAIGMTYV